MCLALIFFFLILNHIIKIGLPFFSSGHFNYKVGLNNMTQTNAATNKTRPIRRVDPRPAGSL
jgi:hypothetical protein